VEATRANADAVAVHGIDEIADHYATYMATQPSRPIVIGHSFGGLLADKLLGDGHAIAGVGIDAAPIKGVLPLPISALRVAFVALKNPGNIDAAVSLTKKAVPLRLRQRNQRGRLRRAFDKWAIPSPGRPYSVGQRQLQPARADQGRHQQPGPRTAAAHHGRQGPHGPGDRQQVDTQEVPAFAGNDPTGRVRRPRPLADHRPRLAGDRRLRPVVAESKGIRDSQRLVRRDATSLPHLASELRPNGCDTSN